MIEAKTDYERFKELFDSVGQEYTLFNNESVTCLQVEGGYPCFFTVFEFTKEGKFVAMGAYE